MHSHVTVVTITTTPATCSNRSTMNLPSEAPMRAGQVNTQPGAGLPEPRTGELAGHLDVTERTRRTLRAARARPPAAPAVPEVVDLLREVTTWVGVVSPGPW